MLVKTFGPQILEMLSGQNSGPSPGQTGPNPNAGPTKFNMGIKDGMNIPNNKAPGGGFGLGMDSMGLGAPTKGTGGWPADDPDWIGPPQQFGGDITVTGEEPFEPPPWVGPPQPGVEGTEGGGGGGPGGLPPWFEKLAAGAQVGEALGQKAPPPPSLPGGGRFDAQNSLLQWLQSMGRR